MSAGASTRPPQQGAPPPPADPPLPGVYPLPPAPPGPGNMVQLCHETRFRWQVFEGFDGRITGRLYQIDQWGNASFVRESYL